MSCMILFFIAGITATLMDPPCSSSPGSYCDPALCGWNACAGNGISYPFDRHSYAYSIYASNDAQENEIINALASTNLAASLIDKSLSDQKPLYHNTIPGRYDNGLSGQSLNYVSSTNMDARQFNEKLMYARLAGRMFPPLRKAYYAPVPRYYARY